MLLLLTGAAILRVSLFSDICLRYVKEGLQPFLIASGFVLVCFGLVGALGTSGELRHGLRFIMRRESTSSAPAGTAPAHDGHDHADVPGIAWLLAAPALVLLMFAPPALGSYTAARDSPKVVEVYDHFKRLPAQGPVPLSLTEFTARVQQDRAKSLGGRTVVLSGFVTPGKNGTWDLTRLLVACCAADSQSLTVTMHGVPAPPPDTWVKVTGTWHPSGALGTASAALALDVRSLERIPQPLSPYKDRPPSA
ncbi:TIGR03943 family putative permease subunit [Streptomyces flavidovirens]|uniref:TIGR03943 family putative permease subunit n=1 Tax=Streptomyces flavidovirens TaxID=67298 RepID=UPI001FCB0C7D|nr:TIGR03943 family protein [Streptomyces flavidovirens]